MSTSARRRGLQQCSGRAERLGGFALNIARSILSAYPRSSLESIVGQFGLGKYVVRLLGQGDIWARSKLELGRRWLSELGLPPSRVLLVGDTLHDLEVAQALEIDCALVAAGHQSSQRLRNGTSQVFASLADLRAVFGVLEHPTVAG